MDVIAILRDLRAQVVLVDEAIIVLERLALGNGKKRLGRPPKFLRPTAEIAPPTHRKRAFSSATRKKMAAAQKKRWADKKAAVGA